MNPEQKKFLFQQLFGDKIPHIEDLSPDNLQRQLGQINESCFTAGVDLLRNYSTFPNKKINELMSLFWKLVGNKLTPSIMASKISSIHFWGEQKGIESIGNILVPENFYQLFMEDPYMQLGALTFTASKARDYYNNKLAIFNDVQHRAYAYEAEYLNTVLQIDNKFKPNSYQSQVLKAYPRGLISLPPHLQYQSLPFIKPANNL